MEALKRFLGGIAFLSARNPKVALLCAAAVTVGVLFMLHPSSQTRESAQEPPARQNGFPPLSTAQDGSTAQAVWPDSGLHAYERAVERRLEEILTLVDGAGQVRVIISLERGRETVFAVDRNTSTTYTQEQDAQGGSRNQHSQTSQETTLIISDRSGPDRPLILREAEPVIGGVIIIAEGGGDVLLRDALIRSTSALLGIGAHQVQVLKMRGL